MIILFVFPSSSHNLQSLTGKLTITKVPTFIFFEYNKIKNYLPLISKNINLYT
ncbi:hypothetical protein LEP1GSC045_1250 [Leptospira interrogans serovar Pomona str. Kennewicki LC82-25]|nr:hypothetical protein LEP1GSC045_1250 [Leptospira interrogans serovar Pomona str. Kennewicki LC82-25]EMI62330.1 hypothetical protein LEP1GSC200_2861 [Leptospira interrogans serovar Pomona str. CSL10083]EMN77362.1 hypothetical protein LEP1GSC102_1516 [Leptospira interrogans str. UI 09600]EMN79350.1 hypothetical protein LEP1GSC106_0267 [Leptospira interrogans serovar Grippotyphosa str. UI 12764]EMN99216.1 hypothetical protein LEP1GSC112_1795 [Leptospira interrogans serovar Pomona str. UT364]